MAITDGFRQEAYSGDTPDALIALLTIQSEGKEDLRVCNVPCEPLLGLGKDVYGVTSNELDYIYIPFDIVLPQDDKTGVVKSTLTMDNIDRNLIPAIRSSLQPVDITIQMVLSSNPDRVEIEFTGLKLSNTNYDWSTISGDLTLEFEELEPFPSGRFLPSNFPGKF